MYIYEVKDEICPKEVRVEIEEDKIKRIIFRAREVAKEDGAIVKTACRGNWQGLKKLIENRNIDEIIGLLKGIKCGEKTSSCPDSVAKALINYKKENGIL